MFTSGTKTMADLNAKLFSITQAFQKFSFGVAVVLIVIALVALCALIFLPGRTGISGDYLDREAATGIWLAGGLVMSILFLVALRKLGKIINSASIGDPFTRENAARLMQIAWLIIAINVVQILCSMAGALFAHDARGGFDLSSIPWSGLFSFLTVLVLAQIFQRGCELRADLEGTV